VSIITKEESVETDEEYAERIALRLVKSIRYKYEPSKGIEEIVQLIKEVIKWTHGFTEESTSHTILS